MANNGRYLKKKDKKPMGKGKKIALIVAIVIVALLLALVIGAVVWYQIAMNLITRPDDSTRELSDAELESILGWNPDATGETDLSDKTTEPTTEATTVATDPDYGTTGKIINIMLVGQNYREGEYSKLSDTMILCTVNKETKTLTLTSFLRDLYVKLPDYKGHTCGKQRINVAYNLGWHWGGELGGMEMLAECIYNNFGVEIDHSVEINFDDFIELIDALGGIEVELSETEAAYLTKDAHNEGSFEAGLTLLDGDSALAYARMRKSSADDNDFKRTERQKKVISEIVDKVRGMSLTEINDLLKIILPMVITDMSNDDITTYLLELLPLLPDLQIASNQCPAEGTYSGQMVVISGYQSGVLVPNLEKNKELLMAIAEADRLEAAETTE